MKKRKCLITKKKKKGSGLEKRFTDIEMFKGAFVNNLKKEISSFESLFINNDHLNDVFTDDFHNDYFVYCYYHIDVDKLYKDSLEDLKGKISEDFDFDVKGILTFLIQCVQDASSNYNYDHSININYCTGSTNENRHVVLDNYKYISIHVAGLGKNISKVIDFIIIDADDSYDGILFDYNKFMIYYSIGLNKYARIVFDENNNIDIDNSEIYLKDKN